MLIKKYPGRTEETYNYRDDVFVGDVSAKFNSRKYIISQQSFDAYRYVDRARSSTWSCKEYMTYTTSDTPIPLTVSVSK